MKKKLINKIITITVIVAVIGSGSLLGYSRYVKAQASKSTQSFLTAKASTGNISINVTASGTVTCPVQTDVLASNNGTIESLSFKEGDTVKKGDVIAKIKDTSAEQAVQTAQNTVNKENVNLANLKKNLDAKTIKAPAAGTIVNIYAVEGDDISNPTKVYGSVMEIQVDGLAKPIQMTTGTGTITKLYVSVGQVINKGDSLYRMSDDDVRASIDSENVTLTQAQNDLANKKASLDKATIVSPLDGMIVTQTLKVGDSITSGKTVATVVDPNQMQTIVPVDELDIQKLTLGMKATVSLDAITGKKFDGEVTKISSVGKTTNNVTTYDVTVTIKSPENVKVGMTANVNIQLQGKDNVVIVPATAVQGRGTNRYVILGSEIRKVAAAEKTTSEGNTSKSGAEVIKTKTLVADLIKTTSNISQVQVGLSDGTNVEITSGLKSGDEIMIPIQTTTNTITSQITSTTMMQGNFQTGTTGSGKQQQSSGQTSTQSSTQSQTQGSK